MFLIEIREIGDQCQAESGVVVIEVITAAAVGACAHFPTCA